MIAMFMLANHTDVVFFPHESGLDLAAAFRRTHAAFKRRRIRHIIQARPDLVTVGVPMARTSPS